MKTEQFEGPSDWSQMRTVMDFGDGNGHGNDNGFDNDNPNANAVAEDQANNDLAASKDDKKKSRRSRSGALRKISLDIFSVYVCHGLPKTG